MLGAPHAGRARPGRSSVNDTDRIVPIKVLIVDDHEVVRRGLCDYLDPKAEIEVVGEAGTAAEALASLDRAVPDVVLLDVRLPDLDGISLCRQMKDLHPTIRCLMLTSFSDEEAMLQAIVAGAEGYILKEVRLDEVLSSIKKVMQGNSLLDPGLVRKVTERLRTGDRGRQLGALTEKERRVFDLMASGATNREIGEQLSLAEQTVKNYASNVLSKLGLARRAQAAALAAELRSAPGHAGTKH